MLMKAMHRNLHLGYTYTALAYFGIAGLWVMFLQQRGLTLVEIGLCESINHITAFVFQVPAGILADRFSYRATLIIGRIAALGHGLIMLLAPSHAFWWFAFAFFLLGWSMNLQSGTLEAILYESLVKLKQTKRYPKVTSMINTVLKVTSMSGLIIAGWIIHDYPLITYRIYVLMAVIALLVAIFLKEPARHLAGSATTQPNFWQLIRHVATSFRQLPQLAYLIAFNAIFTVVGSSYYNYFQAVLAAHGFKGPRLSGILALVMLGNVLFVQLTPRMQQRWSPFNLLSGLTVGLSLIFLLSGFNQLAFLLGGYFLVNMLMAGIAPIMSSYFNAIIPSGQRATVLSVSGMVYSIVTSISFPVIGGVIERLGFATTFAWLGAGLMILAVIAVGIRHVIVTPSK